MLVNNSGVYEFAPLEADHRGAASIGIFNINVLGLLLVTQAAAKHLAEGGSMINIGSAVTRITPANSAVYTATKGAVDAITGVLSRELGPRRIRVNSINPGMVETEGTPAQASSARISKSDWSRKFPSVASDNPMKSPTSRSSWRPEESRWLTGETLIASGGMR